MFVKPKKYTSDLKSQQQTGAGFTAHASLGKGSSTENTSTHTNTTVQVAGATHNDIAGNLTLDGANLTTKHLTGTLGGDLIVKSRQDTYQYDSKQQNISGSADIDFSGKLQNANINAGKQQLNAQYAQVTNQSGIIANTSSLNVQGQGKFTGGYLITDANQNHTQFKQGIQTQDIHNHLNYQGDALQVGVSLAPKSKSSQDSTSNKTKHQLGLSGLGYGKIDPIHKTSITKSAITDQAGLSHINTGNLSSKDSQQALNPIISNDFTNQKSQLEKELGGQTTVTTEFGREIPKQIGDYAQDKEIELLAQGNIEEAQKWAEGGVYRVALHTTMGALATGTAEGAFATGSAASAAPQLNHLQAKLKQKLSEQGLESDTAEIISQSVLNLTLAGIGTSAGLDTGSTVYALNTDVNNRQLHPDEIRFILDEDRVRRFADKYGLTDKEARSELLQVALAYHDKEWANIYNWNNFPKDEYYGDGKTLRTRALDFLWDENEKYGSFDLFSRFNKSTYDDPVINLKKLFDNTDKTYVQDFLRISYQKVDPKVAYNDFVRGGQQGAVQANQEASFQKDIENIIPTLEKMQETIQYAKQSITSDEIGPYDDKKMQAYYENLLRLQGRYEELGRIQGKDWNETQRAIATGNLLAPIRGAFSQGAKVVSKTIGKGESVAHKETPNINSSTNADANVQVGDGDLPNVDSGQNHGGVSLKERIQANIADNKKAKSHANSENVHRIEHNAKLTTTRDGNLSVTHGLGYDAQKELNGIRAFLAENKADPNQTSYLNRNGKADEISIATATVTTKDGKTINYLAVSGKSWSGHAPDKVTIHGKEYQVIREEAYSGYDKILPDRFNPKNNQYNGNHAEKKIMSHITQQNQNSANIDSIQLNIQNTSDEFKGACYGCGGQDGMGGTIEDFKNLNKDLKIRIEHGSTGTRP